MKEITYHRGWGEEKCIFQWARDTRNIYALSGAAIRARVSTGMTVEEALSTPKKTPKQKAAGRKRPKPATTINICKTCGKSFKITEITEHGLCPVCWKREGWTETDTIHDVTGPDFWQRFRAMCEAWGV